jgi:hypothetical protein
VDVPDHVPQNVPFFQRALNTVGLGQEE